MITDFQLENLYETARKKVTASPQDFIWNEGELAYLVFSLYEGPERDEPTDQHCRKMAKALLKLKPVGIEVRTKSGADEVEEEPSNSDEETTNGTPFLLPIANMEGYSVDPWGRPHADKRAGRKAGPVGLDKFFSSKGRKEKTPRFVCGYRVRVGGKRKRYRPTYFAMARFFAEQKYLNGEV